MSFAVTMRTGLLVAPDTGRIVLAVLMQVVRRCMPMPLTGHLIRVRRRRRARAAHQPDDGPNRLRDPRRAARNAARISVQEGQHASHRFAPP